LAASISVVVTRYLLVPIVVVWVYHLFQRRFRDQGRRKRDATLYLTLALLGVWVLVYLLARFSLADLYLAPIAFFTLVALVWQRGAIFPYRLRCARCGLPLAVSRILFYDSNTCETCELHRKEGENQR
jgi:hypothetical protein